MKRIILTTAIFALFACLSDVYGQNGFVVKNREMLKEYFLHSCIRHGFDECDTIFKKDHSGAVYIDLLRYNLKAINKVDSLAQDFVSSIEVSPYENRKTKGIIILSIREYKSKRLDDFIKSLDSYMLKD